VIALLWALYLSLVRRAAGNLPVVATVMRPTPYQLKTYPYRAEAPYVDVFAPMVYWSCSEPGALAVQSVRALAKLLPRPRAVLSISAHWYGDGSYVTADEQPRSGRDSGKWCRSAPRTMS